MDVGDPGGTDAARLELEGLSLRYTRDGPHAVADLTLAVPAGEVCVLIGPSGCGKTSALRMINRLVEPTAGRVLIDGRDIRDRPAARLRREIGYVIQQVGLLPHLTVRANVAAVPRLLGWDRQRTAVRVRELLHLVGLDPDEYAARYPAQLSGGQQQRVGLARALAGDPPLLLMDEPFSAVDPITRLRLQNDFLRLHRAVPKTVVMVSHDIDEAVRMADRIAVMRDGRLVQYAPPAELLARPADRFVSHLLGADRALKSLALVRLEQIATAPAPTVRAGSPLQAVRERIAAGALVPVGGRLLIVDDDDRPLAWWAPDEGAAGDGDRVPGRPSGGAEPLLDRPMSLRDALSAIFGAGSSHGVVIDGAGRATGVIDAQRIARHAHGEGEPAMEHPSDNTQRPG
ncbi:MAG TPA: ABC transporter ATP-binding protein [Miltoncostaeaceae bacterium]|nr:ABC transporter ATP-binding protein [Miltoncostaeaceae bacterium]